MAQARLLGLAAVWLNRSGLVCGFASEKKTMAMAKWNLCLFFFGIFKKNMFPENIWV